MACIELSPEFLATVRPFQRIILKKLAGRPSGMAYEDFKPDCPWFGIGTVVTKRLKAALEKIDLQIVIKENFKGEPVYKLCSNKITISRQKKKETEQKTINKSKKSYRKKKGKYSLPRITMCQDLIFKALNKHKDGLFLADLEKITDIGHAYRNVTPRFVRTLEDNGYKFIRSKIGHRTLFKIEKIIEPPFLKE